MANRSFRRGASAISSNRRTQWTASADIAGYTTLAAAASVLDQTLSNAVQTTVMRTRGSISVLSDQIITSEEPFGAIGMCIVSDQAAAVGISSIPTPMTEAESDLWFVHEFFYAPVTFVTAVGMGDISQTFHFDSKAMRKVAPNETIFGSVSAETEVGAATLAFVADTRMLVKLS